MIEYSGKRILLPGDLEEEGLSRLLACNPVDVEILMAARIVFQLNLLNGHPLGTSLLVADEIASANQ